MSWTDILKLIAVILSIGGTAYAAVRFVLGEKKKQSELTEKIEKLQKRLDIVTTSIREDVDRYQALQEISTNAEIAVAASMHSISVPVPHNNPTRLRFIISTDPEAEKILGKEFPISNSLAGQVFSDKRPKLVNRAIDDPEHNRTVDKAAKTNTGEGAILTYPLLFDEECMGVMQFMKSPGERFHDEDLKIVGRFSHKVARKIGEIESNAHNDTHLGELSGVFHTVLFTDINDFSTLAKNMTLRESVSLLDEYYRRLLGLIPNYDSAFEEYLGDGIYLSFHGETKSDGAFSALRCAQALQTQYEELLEEWSIYQYPVSTKNFHNIGIASGNVFEGTVGHQLHRRRKLIGQPINLAAHLVEEGKQFGGCVLVDTETYTLVNAGSGEFLKKGTQPDSYLLKNIG